MPDMTEPAETVVSAPPVEVQRAVLVTKLTLGVSLVLSLVAVLNGEPAALLGFFFGLFVIWLVLFLLRRIERGINWARITLLTLTVLGLAMTLLSAPILWDEGPVSFLLFDIPIALLSALAAWWLVTEPARVWFRQVREQPRVLDSRRTPNPGLRVTRRVAFARAGSLALTCSIQTLSLCAPEPDRSAASAQSRLKQVIRQSST